MVLRTKEPKHPTENPWKVQVPILGIWEEWLKLSRACSFNKFSLSVNYLLIYSGSAAVYSLGALKPDPPEFPSRTGLHIEEKILRLEASFSRKEIIDNIFFLSFKGKKIQIKVVKGNKARKFHKARCYIF